MQQNYKKKLIPNFIFDCKIEWSPKKTRSVEDLVNEGLPKSDFYYVVDILSLTQVKSSLI